MGTLTRSSAPSLRGALVLCLGIVALQCARAAERVAAAVEVRSVTGGLVVLEVGSGNYRFRSTSAR